jgi:hypothetical protein
MFLMVLFMILMVFWLLSGGFVAYGSDNVFNGRAFGGYTLIPWCCVAILGFIIFSGGVVVVAPVAR